MARSKIARFGFVVVDTRTGEFLSPVFAKRDPARAIAKRLYDESGGTLFAGVHTIEAHVPADWRRGDSVEPYLDPRYSGLALKNPLPPLPNPSPRVKAWVKTLLQHGSDIGHAIGFTLGPVLGCGHWGCVVDLPSTPWVLKLTIDPTEAFVWRRIVDLIEAEAYGQGGFPRVKGIYELQPGITYGSKGRKHRAFAIVREKAMPVFTSKMVTTEWTVRRLDLAAPLTAQQMVPWDTGKIDTGNYKLQETQTALRATVQYRMFARDMRSGLLGKDSGYSRIERAINAMYGSIGGPLGESLQMLLSNEFILHDVHLGNIGWRQFAHIDGYEDQNEGLVIFDPGHTPTDKSAKLPAVEWKDNPAGSPWEWVGGYGR